VPDGVPVLRAGAEQVDLAVALAALGGQGSRVVVAEGGPSLNGDLLQAGLVDELCLTVAPVLAGGRSARVAVGASAARHDLTLVHVATADDGYLFLRYARAEGS
jgi:5-amino-6-(5-phosphoribosylamino)uracil reductase